MSLGFERLIKLEFSRQIFEKNSHIRNYAKFLPVGAEWFHEDGWNDKQTWRSWYPLYTNLRM